MNDKAKELWSQLQEIQKEEMETLKNDRIELEDEKRQMKKLKTDSSDVITIDVGGATNIRVHRDTLCLATGSMFSNMFNGRWEDSLVVDSEGRVFLDHDPDIIQWIINFLRVKKLVDPSKPIHPPLIPDGKKDKYMFVLKYFGLTPFFFPKQPFPELVLSQSGNNVIMTATENDDGGRAYRCVYKGSNRYHYFAAFTPSFSGEETFWKCTITALPHNDWLYLGVIGSLDATADSYSHSTSFGWGCNNQRYVAGASNPGSDGWTNFQQREVLYFKRTNRNLKMFSILKNRCFSIDGIPESAYIHLNFLKNNTEVLLESVGPWEVSGLAW